MGRAVVRRVLLQSIRLAASLRERCPTLLPSTSRRTLTPAQKQNRDETAIFKCEGLCILGEQVPGRWLKGDSLDPSNSPAHVSQSQMLRAKQPS